MADDPTATAAVPVCGITTPHNHSSFDDPIDCAWRDRQPTTAALPTYDDLMTSLDGCSEALSRLMDAVRGLFESAGTADGHAYAVDKLKDAHDAAVDWCATEARLTTAWFHAKPLPSLSTRQDRNTRYGETRGPRSCLLPTCRNVGRVVAPAATDCAPH